MQEHATADRRGHRPHVEGACVRQDWPKHHRTPAVREGAEGARGHPPPASTF